MRKKCTKAGIQTATQLKHILVFIILTHLYEEMHLY